jgi:hypothetical protein
LPMCSSSEAPAIQGRMREEARRLHDVPARAASCSKSRRMAAVIEAFRSGERSVVPCPQLPDVVRCAVASVVPRRGSMS